MTQTRTIAASVHDAIDEITTAVEDIHKSVAEVPLTILEIGRASCRERV